MAAAKYQIRRKCELCGAEFLAKTLDSRYCSRACSKKAYNKRKAEESKRLQQDMLISRIPDGRDYISVSEAEAPFGVSMESSSQIVRMSP